MFLQEQKFYSADTQHQQSGDNKGVLLKPTGQRIPSITSGVDIFQNPESESYFVKPVNDAGMEFNQLGYLKSVGLPTPKDILISDKTDTMATSYAGESFSLSSSFYQAGLFLRQVHDVLDQKPPEDNAIQYTYQHTAHIVDNFFYKHLNMVDMADYRRYKKNSSGSLFIPNTSQDISDFPVFNDSFIPLLSDGSPNYKELISEANRVAHSLLERLKPAVVILDTDKVTNQGLPFLPFKDAELFYGDFKPDNILVDPEDPTKFTLIDPLISKGSKSFDLAKFTARVNLENDDSSKDLLSDFYRGYGIISTVDIPGYGPFQFNDLVTIDTLNILKSYAKRFSRGDTAYHAVMSLQDPIFCDKLRQLII